jgi:hypothetical protein
MRGVVFRIFESSPVRFDQAGELTDGAPDAGPTLVVARFATSFLWSCFSNFDIGA